MRQHAARLLFALAILGPTLACWGPLDARDGAGEEAAEGDGRPDIAITLYQGPLELFMEHPAFVVGSDHRHPRCGAL